MSITSPYNFIKLNSKVVYPYWGEAISHDQPFKDSQSGKLEIKIQAESPIYVRNGSQQTGDPDTSFNQMDGRYFIPGTSLKGMIRSIVEILSNGSMIDRVNEVKLSQRDWQNPNIYPKSEISDQVLGGWLRKEEDCYILKPCGKPGRISHKKLDILVTDTIKNIAGAKMSTFYSSKDYFRINDKTKSAKGKYETFPIQLTGSQFEIDPESAEKYASEVYKISPAGDRKGTIVLTGQPGLRNEKDGKGKHLEFIFFESEQDEILVPKEVIENFKFAYYDHDAKSQKPDWKWRKKLLDSGDKIPVFYRMEGKKILDMGLTQLFKITYTHSVKELIEHSQTPQLKQPDLADCIFGYVNKEFSKNHQALKGRVSFAHAWAEENPKPMDTKVSVVLSSPKSSYYPNYLVQPANMGPKDKYQTMNNLAEIRGYKRYPVRTMIKHPEYAPNVGEKVKTHFYPLPPKTIFKTEAAYHNLRLIELGALISALTFHGTEGYFHSLGMAKSLGYGKVKISISGIDQTLMKKALGAFESWMEDETNHGWRNSTQLKQLLAMARSSQTLDKQLEYMALNEFSEAKTKSQVLMDILAMVDPSNHLITSHLDSSQLTDQIASVRSDREFYQRALSITDSEGRLTSKLNRIKESLLHEVEAIKKTLLDKLSIQRNALLQEQQAITQKMDSLNKISKPFDVSEVKLNARAFEDLEKKMRVYSHLYQSGPIEGKVEQNLLVEKIKEIYALLPKKELGKWNESNRSKNNYFKKITAWLGAEQTEALFKNVEGL